ncbi:MAG: NUDIX domain-containing protein [Pyrinomonadaceae bacterium]|nr:NUDIX domain-containing protein [Pyrinomonadaceae bacterium]
MWKNIISKIWNKFPKYLRYRAVRATQRKFTVSAGAVVLNEKGEVLLLDHLLRPTANGWGIPGGFINPSEQLDDAVRREVFEETGLELENLQLVWVRTIYRHIEAIFVATGKGEAKVKSLEIKEVKWFPLDNLPKEMTELQEEIVRKALSKKTN